MQSAPADPPLDPAQSDDAVGAGVSAGDRTSVLGRGRLQTVLVGGGVGALVALGWKTIIIIGLPFLLRAMFVGRAAGPRQVLSTFTRGLTGLMFVVVVLIVVLFVLAT